MGLRRLVIAVICALAALSTASAAATPQDVGGSPSQAPIVIPPATVGLAAASEDLQRALDETSLPTTEPELLAELAKRAGDVQMTIASGAFGQVWVPAMATKTVALVLESHVSQLAERERSAARAAIKQIVVAAWDLDTFGDLGNKQQLDGAYTRLASGVAELKMAYAAH
jgi:hypothetical protein